MTAKSKIQIDVISDVMCPWCYIGKTNLDDAIGQVPELDVEVFWRPYQLDNTLPKEGIDRAEYLNKKFGGEKGAQEVYGRIKYAGKVLGIDFNFDAMQVSPNTLDAHRVILWAGGKARKSRTNWSSACSNCFSWKADISASTRFWSMQLTMWGWTVVSLLFC